MYLPKQLDIIFNSINKLTTKNMYLFESQEYYLIKTRNNNNLLNTLCKTLKIE